MPWRAWRTWPMTDAHPFQAGDRVLLIVRHFNRTDQEPATVTARCGWGEDMVMLRLDLGGQWVAHVSNLERISAVIRLADVVEPDS